MSNKRLSMEITMTDQSVLLWVHEVLGVGTLTKKPRKGLRKDGAKYLCNTGGVVHSETRITCVCYSGLTPTPN